MKKILIAIILIAMFLGVNHYAHHYTRAVTVVHAYNNDIVVADEYGHEWAFVGSGYKVGDIITVKMNTNGTDNNISDDEIVGVLT